MGIVIALLAGLYIGTKSGQKITQPEDTYQSLSADQNEVNVVGQNTSPSPAPAPAPAPVNANLVAKNSWGLSFEKGSEWSITQNTNNQVVMEQASGSWVGDTITMEYITGQSVSNSDSKFGTVTYSYNAPSQSWMRDGVVATPEFYTQNNLPVFLGVKRWKTYVIPTSTTSFVVMNITGSGNADALDALAQTIQ